MNPWLDDITNEWKYMHTTPIKYIASKYVKNLKDVHDTAQSSVKKTNK